MSREQRAKLPALGPVTRWQLEVLEWRLRRPPVRERHLTPGGVRVEVVKRTERESDQIEAAYIRNRLDAAKARAESAAMQVFRSEHATRDFARVTGGRGDRKRERNRGLGR